MGWAGRQADITCQHRTGKQKWLVILLKGKLDNYF